MLRRFTIVRLGMLILCAARPVPAQELEFSVSPAPVGSGARAAGMADAFVAIADDATAASWNPAGLVQLERPELSIVGSWNTVTEDFDLRNQQEFSRSHGAGSRDLNFLSIAWPLPVPLLGRNATLSLSYQRKYDFSRSFSGPLNTSSAGFGGSVSRTQADLDYEQEGGLGAITPAVAIELTQRLSVGVAFNFWRSNLFGDNSWSQELKSSANSFGNGRVTRNASLSREEFEDFSGKNLTLGLLWNPNARWSLGLRYDTRFEGALDYASIGYALESRFIGYGDAGRIAVTPSASGGKRWVQFPAAAAVGAACRVNDRLTLSFDLTRIDWNDFYIRDNRGTRFSLVDFTDLSAANRPDFDPAYTARLGMEYVFLPKKPRPVLKALWTLRGGLFFDQEPATGRDNPREAGDGRPDNFYGFALGAGIQINQRVNFDVAYQYRIGKDVNADYVRGAPGFSEDFEQQRILASIILYF